MESFRINNDFSENVNYDYSDYAVYVRRALLSAYPDYSAESHWHDDIELILILSGEMQYNINGEIITLGKNEGVLVNSRRFHYGYSENRTECDFICVLFHPLLLCTVQSFERKFIKPIFLGGGDYIHLRQSSVWQRQILNGIKKIWDCRESFEAPLLTQANIFEIWASFVANINTNREKHDDTALSTLKAMVDYIHKSYCDKITLENIAKAGNVSKRTCCGIFSKYLNKTPITYLNEHRLRKAIELIKESDKNMLEISLAVGFSGSSYFAEVFRKSFGLSPTEYKKQLTAESR